MIANVLGIAGTHPGALSIKRERFSRFAAVSAQRVSAWTSAQRTRFAGIVVMDVSGCFGFQGIMRHEPWHNR